MLECNTKTMLREDPWLPPGNIECVPQRDTPLWIVSLDPHGCTNMKCFVLSFCLLFYCSVALSGVFLFHLFYVNCFFIVVFAFSFNHSLVKLFCFFLCLFGSLYISVSPLYPKFYLSIYSIYVSVGNVM